MSLNEISEEAEYIYSIIYKNYLNDSIVDHAVTIWTTEFSDDLSESAFEIGLEELKNLHYISDYVTYIDGSYQVTLGVRCSKALKEGKSSLSMQLSNSITEKKPALDLLEENPPYIRELINNGVILKDMNVVKSLNDVAGYIHDNYNEIKITKQLLKQFHHNGKEYSEKKLEEAVTYAYSIDR